MWLYLTPVFYPAGIVPPAAARWQGLNPMLHLVECFRAPLYLGQLPGPDTLLTAAAAALGMLLLGWLVFTSQADQLTYRV
jgi:ABC-type polysaccharide/polyol phosphate export permease